MAPARLRAGRVRADEPGGHRQVPAHHRRLGFGRGQAAEGPSAGVSSIAMIRAPGSPAVRVVEGQPCGTMEVTAAIRRRPCSCRRLPFNRLVLLVSNAADRPVTNSLKPARQGGLSHFQVVCWAAALPCSISCNSAWLRLRRPWRCLIASRNATVSRGS